MLVSSKVSSDRRDRVSREWYTVIDIRSVRVRIAVNRSLRRDFIMDAMMGGVWISRRSSSLVVEWRSFRCNLHYNYARVSRIWILLGHLRVCSTSCLREFWEYRRVRKRRECRNNGRLLLDKNVAENISIRIRSKARYRMWSGDIER